MIDITLIAAEYTNEVSSTFQNIGYRPEAGDQFLVKADETLIMALKLRNVTKGTETAELLLKSAQSNAEQGFNVIQSYPKRIWATKLRIEAILNRTTVTPIYTRVECLRAFRDLLDDTSTAKLFEAFVVGGDTGLSPPTFTVEMRYRFAVDICAILLSLIDKLDLDERMYPRLFFRGVDYGRLLIDAKEGNPPRSRGLMDVDGKHILCMDVFADGSRMYSGSSFPPGEILVWDLEQRPKQFLHRLPPISISGDQLRKGAVGSLGSASVRSKRHTRPVMGLKLFRNLMATASLDGTILIWDTQKQKQLSTSPSLPSSTVALPPVPIHLIVNGADSVSDYLNVGNVKVLSPGQFDDAPSKRLGTTMAGAISAGWIAAAAVALGSAFGGHIDVIPAVLAGLLVGLVVGVAVGVVIYTYITMTSPTVVFSAPLMEEIEQCDEAVSRRDDDENNCLGPILQSLLDVWDLAGKMSDRRSETTQQEEAVSTTYDCGLVGSAPLPLFNVWSGTRDIETAAESKESDARPYATTSTPRSFAAVATAPPSSSSPSPGARMSAIGSKPPVGYTCLAVAPFAVPPPDAALLKMQAEIVNMRKEVQQQTQQTPLSPEDLTPALPEESPQEPKAAYVMVAGDEAGRVTLWAILPDFLEIFAVNSDGCDSGTVSTYGTDQTGDGDGMKAAAKMSWKFTPKPFKMASWQAAEAQSVTAVLVDGERVFVGCQKGLVLCWYLSDILSGKPTNGIELRSSQCSSRITALAIRGNQLLVGCLGFFTYPVGTDVEFSFDDGTWQRAVVTNVKVYGVGSESQSRYDLKAGPTDSMVGLQDNWTAKNVTVDRLRIGRQRATKDGLDKVKIGEPLAGVQSDIKVGWTSGISSYTSLFSPTSEDTAASAAAAVTVTGTASGEIANLEAKESIYFPVGGDVEFLFDDGTWRSAVVTDMKIYGTGSKRQVRYEVKGKSSEVLSVGQQLQQNWTAKNVKSDRLRLLGTNGQGVAGIGSRAVSAGSGAGVSSGLGRPVGPTFFGWDISNLRTQPPTDAAWQYGEQGGGVGSIFVDKNCVFTGSYDKTVTIWAWNDNGDIPTSKPTKVRAIEGFGGAVHCLRVLRRRSDVPRLLAGTSDYNIEERLLPPRIEAIEDAAGGAQRLMSTPDQFQFDLQLLDSSSSGGGGGGGGGGANGSIIGADRQIVDRVWGPAGPAYTDDDAWSAVVGVAGAALCPGIITKSAAYPSEEKELDDRI